MPWARLDDNFALHRKTLRAAALLPGEECLQRVVGQYTVALLYANKYLTDGFIPDEEITTMQGESIAEVLVRVHLWERVAGGYQIHDYHDHNDSAADVKARRKADSERKRLARGGVPAPSPSSSLPLSGSAPPPAPVPPDVSARTPAGQPLSAQRPAGLRDCNVQPDKPRTDPLSNRSPDGNALSGWTPAGHLAMSARTPRPPGPAGAPVRAPGRILTVPSQDRAAEEPQGQEQEIKNTADAEFTDAGRTPAEEAAYQARNAEAEENYRVILRITHDVLGQLGRAIPDGDAIEAIKWACAKAKVTYNSRVVQKAYDAAKHARSKPQSA
jgi:hypothetical protein